MKPLEKKKTKSEFGRRKFERVAGHFVTSRQYTAEQDSEACEAYSSGRR